MDLVFNEMLFQIKGIVWRISRFMSGWILRFGAKCTIWSHQMSTVFEVQQVRLRLLPCPQERFFKQKFTCPVGYAMPLCRKNLACKFDFEKLVLQRTCPDLISSKVLRNCLILLLCFRSQKLILVSPYEWSTYSSS